MSAEQAHPIPDRHGQNLFAHAIARLGGANRRYIEEEIPHIASLMCESLDPILEHAEVLVVGNGGEDARRGLALARPDQAVVDLTRSVGRSR